MTNQAPLGPLEQAAVMKNICRAIIHAWACTIYPFTRYQFGRDFFGLVQCCSYLVPIAFLLFCSPNEEDTQLLIGHWLLMFVFNICHRIVANFGRFRHAIHSRYDGKWWLSKSMPDEEAKGLHEPFFVAAIGFSLWFNHSSEYAIFLMIGGIAAFLDFHLWKHRMARQVTRMNDAEIEQGVLMEIYDQIQQRNRRTRR